MPGAVPRAWGAWLAIVVCASASISQGQAPAPPSQGTPTLSPEARSDDHRVLSEGQQRLEEMKVELALLSDMDAFPYSIGASYQDETLQLYGFVPDDLIRKNIVDLARSNTFLHVRNGIGIRTDLSVQPTARPAAVLQQEGNALLLTHARDRAKQITLRVREDGVVVLIGRIDSMERKLLISRLFHQLSGCAAVNNQLTVEPIVYNGQRMVQVSRDGKLLVPASMLGLQTESLAASPTPPQRVQQVSYPAKEVSAPENQQPVALPAVPVPLPTNSPAAKQDESSLPTPILPSPPSLTREAAPIHGETDRMSPPNLPVKWGRPNEDWEAQMKQLEITHDRRMPTPQALPQQANMPSASRTKAEDRKPASKPMEARPNQVNAESPLRSPETQAVQPPQMTWRRFGGGESSEPSSTPVAVEREVTTKREASVLPIGPPLRSSRRWPPAYVAAAPSDKGRTGTIVFAEDPPPARPVPAPPPYRVAPAKPVPAPVPTPHRITPTDLQRQVKTLCGEKASDVVVSVQLDGSLLVRVKVPSRTLEDQLSRQILAIPDMTSPRVRLMMEVGP